MGANRRSLGPSRRDLLKVGLLGAWGLGLGDLLRLRSAAEGSASALKPRAKGCILIWLAGGASHLDTFDPKPEAPADVRGEFGSIGTALPGVAFSEVLPELAKQLNRFTLVRSLTTPEADHDRATQHVLTGYRPNPAMGYPCVGSVVAKVRGMSGGVLPPFVALPDAPTPASSGYLTPAFDPFAIPGDPSRPDFRVRDLTPPDRVTLDRLRRRRAMVRDLDGFANDVPETPLTAARDQFATQAFDLLTSRKAQGAFRLNEEPAAVRDRYGRDSLGQSCLLARRLIEAGVGFVTVNDRGTGPLGWDTHVQGFQAIRQTLAPPLDRAASALIGDLADRGMLGETMVLVMGEFGRTPKINGNAGRDHHGRANSLILAGGGMPAGLVLGKTDASGDAPAERPVSPADLAATVYSALGIDPSRHFTTPDGQPILLVDGGTPIRELL